MLRREDDYFYAQPCFFGADNTPRDEPDGDEPLDELTDRIRQCLTPTLSLIHISEPTRRS
eukprot:5865620-Prymnesium_polylepis.1